MDEATARRCLEERLGQLPGDGAERRHEALMEWATGTLELTREYAEQVYAIAEEEEVEPVYALHLVTCGVGVLELEQPEDEGDASQQAPPGWEQGDRTELQDIVLERRLRATLRRFRAQLEAAGTPAAAVRAFLAGDDIGVVVLRPE